MIINSRTIDSLILESSAIPSPPPWTIARHSFRVIKSQVRMKISVCSYLVKNRVEWSSWILTSHQPHNVPLDESHIRNSFTPLQNTNHYTTSQKRDHSSAMYTYNTVNRERKRRHHAQRSKTAHRCYCY